MEKSIMVSGDLKSKPNTDGEQRLRIGIEDLADQLCAAVDGDFDFKVSVAEADDSIQKLQLLVNFVLDAARRSLTSAEAKFLQNGRTSRALSQTVRRLEDEMAQRNEAEVALSLREARLRAILSSTLDPTLSVDARGTILDASRSVERVLGWKPEELVGQNVRILAAEPHRSKHDQYLADYLASGQTRIIGSTRELDAVRKDGSRFPCELTVWKADVPGESEPLFSGTIRDITDRKETESKIRDLARFPAENPSAVLRVDCEGVVLYANDAAESLLDAWNCRRGEVVPSEIRQINAEALYAGTHRQVDIPCGDRVVCLTVAPILGSAQVNLYAQDVTARNQAESDLREAAKASEAADQAKSEFLANMSHEIRTPMTAILGFADVLAENVVETGNVEAVETIKRNGQHLLEIINDILDLSKIDAGQFDIRPEPFSPARLLAEVAELMRVKSDAKGLALTVRIVGAIPATIQSDAMRLRQVLINLVGNAIKFTEVGEVRIVTRLVEADGRDPMLLVEVIDTGIGIDLQQLTSLFQPFTQADTSATREFGGTGLGLAISRRLAEMLGGDITATRNAEGGSTFRLTIATGPLDAVAMVDEARVRDKDSEPPANATPRNTERLDCRILLAEDGPDNQRLISFLLKKAGAEVTVADNGQVAVELATAARDEGTPFDLILMDMQMPVLDGYDATRRLRQDGHDGPIIALTAHAMAGDREKCLDAGCDDYASKPIDRQQLIALIDRWVTGRRLTSTAPDRASGS